MSKSPEMNELARPSDDVPVDDTNKGDGNPRSADDEDDSAKADDERSRSAEP